MRQGAALAIFLAGTLSCAPAVEEHGWEEYDIVSLQEAMSSGELTAVELVDYYLERIAALDRSGPELRSIIELNPDATDIARALDREREVSGPRGPLHGIPVVLKANIDTGDQMATHAGSLAIAGNLASDDAFLVAELRNAGAVILAKANLSEWANFRSTRGSSGWSSIGGQTRNPYDPLRTPCGSSSGSAVAVSANLTVLAVGTETDGSIMCPAGVNGIVGIKPTVGLISRDGIIPIAHSQDTAGPMARTVRDAALMLTAMSAGDPSDPAAVAQRGSPVDYAASLSVEALRGKRIGVLRSYGGAGSNPYVEEIFADAIESLRGQGAEIVDPIVIDAPGLAGAEFEVLLYEFREGLNAYLAASNGPMGSLADILEFNTSNAGRVMPFFGQEIMVQAEARGALTEPDYVLALATSRRLAQDGIDRALAGNDLDVLVAPTNGPAAVIDYAAGDRPGVSSSTLAAVAGYPSMTVPAGYAMGLPVGLSFIGVRFGERALIGMAYAFEQATEARRAPGW